MTTVGEDRDFGGQGRYTLTDAEHGHVWGVAAEADGLFGEPRRATYELLGWEPEVPETLGWLGVRLWLVPEDETLGPWLLRDADSPVEKTPAGTDSLVLAGLDDYEGPPEGHRGRVRVHNGRHWLGSARELTRILPPDDPAPPLTLRALAPGPELRAALAKGTRRALDLEEAALQIRDDRGDPLTARVLWTRVRSWQPSARGTDLIDLELDGTLHAPVPEHARPVWERWFTGPPHTRGAWACLDTRGRDTWLDLVRERSGRHRHPDRPPHHTYVLDGRHITDEPALHLALGEAVNGPGGYFGGCPAALDDCLGGTFGYTAPATLLWREAATARAHLSHVLTPDGRPYDLFTETLESLTRGGMRVVLA